MEMAGVDTWSPAWQLDPHSVRFAGFRERCTVRTARGGCMLGEVIAGHRIGCFPTGLVFAEGHPAGDGNLCPPDALLSAGLLLQEQLVGAEIPLDPRLMPFGGLGSESEGFVGLRRMDSTVNLAAPSSAQGLALLAGIAAVARDSAVAEVRYGRDRGVETVYLHGHGGKTKLGRWYDKALESLSGPRGSVIRGEDQRRWDKGARPLADEWTAAFVRERFQRRFYPLYKASKGVTVAGPIAIAEKLQEAVDAGEIKSQQARLLAGDLLLEAAGRQIAAPSTARRSKLIRQGLGLVLADGVLQEVEVNVHDVLELALESEAWGRQG